jgi:hypothetical protein
MKLIFKVADGDTKVDDNVLESVDTVKESRTRYHPWHMPEAPANEAPLVAPKPSVQANPPAGPAFYYPIQELERAVELRESQKRSNGLNFSIYRGARKAFGVGVSDDADADVTSGVSRTASVMTLLQIAIAVVAVALRAACH